MTLEHDNTPAASGEPTPLLWTNKQLLLEAETIVVGQFGTEAVYKVLRTLRDYYEANRSQLCAELADLARLTPPAQADGDAPVGDGAGEGQA